MGELVANRDGGTQIADKRGCVAYGGVARQPASPLQELFKCFEYLATELAWEVGDHHRLLDRVEDVVFQRLIQALGDVAEAQLGDVEIAILDFLLGLLLLASLGLPD